MKKHIIVSTVILFMFLWTGIIHAELDDVMHPKFSLLDKDGNTVLDETGEISTPRTCGQCHDTGFINRHNLHYTDKVKADCIVCHFKDSKMSGDYSRAHLKIQLPSDQNCSYCHGIVHSGSEPLGIPADYTESIDYTGGKKFYNLTQHTGVILSPQDLAGSAVNLSDKQGRNFEWDIHSARQLDCVACHFIQNDPRYCGMIQSPLDHLTKDPRKIKPPSQYLKRPNHDLNNATCTCCHNAFAVHKNMPYKLRHMEALSCESCHVPELFGPAFQTVDETVVTPERTARIELRGVDENESHGNSLNTRYYKGYRPFLFPHTNKKGQLKISPFNFVTRWTWKSGKTGETVPPDVLHNIYFGDSGETYSADVLSRFDADQNKKIDARELVLDSDEKVNFIKEKLAAAGIEEPKIAGTVEAYKVNHGVINAKRMKRDCTACHSEDSRIGGDVVLANRAPEGITPEFAKDTLPIVDAEVTRGPDGTIRLIRPSSISGHYVFGHGRVKSLDRVGLLIFILSLLFALFHGGLRWYSSLKHPHHHVETKKVYMYGAYERLWHWTMAAGVIILALTGLEIHYAGSFRLFGLEAAVSIHNVLAAILVVNAVLSLFFHLATGEIKQFFRFNRKFIHETLVQGFYYIHDIFKRAPHPINKTTERKLNPLQQLTYIGLLNVLLPFQVITGILIWGVGRWPAVSTKLGGLTFLAPIHNLGAWLFLSFLVVHIYLTTTGHTVFANIKAMVTGYDDVVEGEPAEEHLTLMDMRLLDLTGTLIGRFVKRKPKKAVTEDNNE
jgi:thiosulfate reductase cytochrome b subunit